MLRYRLLVFDWDGTLMDSAARIVDSMQAAIRDLSLPPREGEELRNVIGLGLQEALAALYPQGSGLEQKALAERYRHYYLDVDPTPSQLFKGVKPLLEQLHSHGYLMAIATGKSRLGLDQALQEMGLEAYFCISRCADETASKPDPRMLMEIMAQMQVSARETLMIGDTEYDLLMAKNAGIDAVGVDYGVHAPERLRRCGPVACVDSIEALQTWLLRPPYGWCNDAS